MFKILRKRKIDYLLKSYNRQRSFLDFDHIRNILILFHYKDLKQVENIYNDLVSEKKHVILWGYDDNKNQASSITPNIDITRITRKAISRLGSISSDLLSKYDALQYDTIIDLTTSYEYVLYYLLAYNKSEFCIGIRHDEHKIYDFTLIKEDQTNLFETYQQLKKYLNNIRKSTNNL